MRRGKRNLLGITALYVSFICVSSFQQEAATRFIFGNEKVFHIPEFMVATHYFSREQTG
jgi:hypothetical protein